MLGKIFCEKKKEIGWGPIGGKRLNLDGRGGGQTGLFIPKPTKQKKLKKKSGWTRRGKVRGSLNSQGNTAQCA